MLIPAASGGCFIGAEADVAILVSIVTDCDADAGSEPCSVDAWLEAVVASGIGGGLIGRCSPIVSRMSPLPLCLWRVSNGVREGLVQSCLSRLLWLLSELVNSSLSW